MSKISFTFRNILTDLFKITGKFKDILLKLMEKKESVYTCYIIESNPKTYEQIKTIHGPILAHLQKVYEAKGRLYNKKQIKTMFKLLVGHYDNLETNKGVIPVPKSLGVATREELIEYIDFYVNWSIEINKPLEIG